MVDRAQLLTLTGPEMTCSSVACVPRRKFRTVKHGVFTKKPGTLTNDFFINLLDMSTQWQPLPL